MLNLRALGVSDGISVRLSNGRCGFDVETASAGVRTGRLLCCPHPGLSVLRGSARPIERQHSRATEAGRMVGPFGEPGPMRPRSRWAAGQYGTLVMNAKAAREQEEEGDWGHT